MKDWLTRTEKCALRSLDRKVRGMKFDNLPPSLRRFIQTVSVFPDVIHNDSIRILNTDVQTKRKYWPVFAKMIENQFEHGGDKYALEGQPDKEATDWVCELSPGSTGVDWILGTIAKYLARFKNFQREKDLLKIANYCFIAWLKMGYHLKEKHDEDTRREG